LITVVLPTYNSILFLKERMDTILNQTFKDWNCVVIDGYSKDGTWEYLQKIAKGDKRFKLYQFPPKGPYDGWNKGISKATGKYIYIATSDDTMTINCLEKMLFHLEANLDCDIAHCCLTVIDENSKPTSSQWRNWDKVKFHGNKIRKLHIRKAPYDGLVHSGWNTVYTSITQLLIKKSLFRKTGLFSTNFGSIADYEWGVRVGFIANIIHIPEYLATWRIHRNQLSGSSTYFKSFDFYEKLLLLSNYALTQLKAKRITVPSQDEFNQNYYLILYTIALKNSNFKNSFHFFLKSIKQQPFLTIKYSIYYLRGNCTVSFEDRSKSVNRLIIKHTDNTA